MRILALDQSSRVSGWSIYDNDNLIDFGHFSISSSLPVERKMNELMLRSILKDKFHLSFGRKRTEQKQVAQEFVQNKFNITVTEDEADSICLGLAAVLENNHDECAF